MASLPARKKATRYAMLFLISVTLVAGFWFHAEFYRFGLLPLLLVGGVATFLVLLSLQRLATGRPFRLRTDWTLSLPKEAVGGRLDGTQTRAIIPLRVVVPPVGSVANVGLENAPAVARMEVEDIWRCLAEDVEESDVVAAGFKNLEDFREAWSPEGVRDPREILVLVTLRMEAHP